MTASKRIFILTNDNEIQNISDDEKWYRLKKHDELLRCHEYILYELYETEMKKEYNRGFLDGNVRINIMKQLKK